MRWAVRVCGIARKEIVEVVRQPRLLFLLVVGPFTVLILFGLGFTREVPRFRTLFVAPSGSAMAGTVTRFQDRFADYITVVGVTDDLDEAKRRLLARKVDVVAVLPVDPYASVLNNQRAIIDVYHSATDPIIAQAIQVAARLAADELNRQVLAAGVAEGQDASQVLAQAFPDVERALTQGQEAASAGDQAGARSAIDEALPAVEALRGKAKTFFDLLRELPGADAEASEGSANLATLDEAAQQLGASGQTQPTAAQLQVRLATVQKAVMELRSQMEALQRIDPAVLVRPFRAVTSSIGVQVDSAIDFYVPAVLVLLLQHLGVTFSALSLVRERALGITDVFRVSPISGGEVLVGKYVSYLVVGGAVAAALTAAVKLLGVSFAGGVVNFAIALLVVYLGALGIGFLISLVASTDIQAVQLSMVVLLASFLFTGFFLSIDRFAPNLRLIADTLPATHGIVMTRQVMLRGANLPMPELRAAVVIALVTFVLSFIGLRRTLSTRRARLQ